MKSSASESPLRDSSVGISVDWPGRYGMSLLDVKSVEVLVGWSAR